jgi:hypothetical protein
VVERFHRAVERGDRRHLDACLVATLAPHPPLKHPWPHSLVSGFITKNYPFIKNTARDFGE